MMENLENWRKKQHLREVLLSYYFSKKTAAESHRMLVEVYGEHALSRTQCSEWFQRFKSGNFDIKDKERPGQPKKFRDDELETLLTENPCRTQEELAELLNVTQQTISKRLKALGMIQKRGKWTQHDEDFERGVNPTEVMELNMIESLQSDSKRAMEVAVSKSQDIRKKAEGEVISNLVDTAAKSEQEISQQEAKESDISTNVTSKETVKVSNEEATESKRSKHC